LNFLFPKGHRVHDNSVYDKDQLVSKMDLAVLDRHLAILEARLGMIARVLWVSSSA